MGVRKITHNMSESTGARRSGEFWPPGVGLRGRWYAQRAWLLCVIASLTPHCRHNRGAWSNGRPANAVGHNPKGNTMNDQSNAAMLARIAELEAKLAKANAPRKLTLKVSEKGAVSVYGMGKWPVTLYAGQWTRLIGAADEITAFIEANKALLAVKD